MSSLQWLVAQVRLDFGFQLSTLQSEKPVVATLLKANALVRKFKQMPDFALMFRPMDLDGAGIMVVTDAALGNVKADGSLGHDSSPMEKVHSQASYFVLLADKKLMAGDEGQFAILDGRSHRLQRVCRSTFGSELLGTEEAFDVGQYCRGIWACVKGRVLRQRQVDNSLNSVGLAVVTDAKDVYDKGSSDTATYGSQKALAFTVAWIRDVLRRPQTCLKWTSTENMFADAGTKEMDQSHLQRILMSGRWSVKYRPAFVKQTNKGNVKIQQTSGSELVVGKPLKESDVVFNYLHQLGESPGWHFKNNIAVHVARNAGRTEHRNPDSTRRNFQREAHMEDSITHLVTLNGVSWKLIGECAGILVTLFHPNPQLGQQKLRTS